MLNVVAITGAGLSVESGVRTYRGATGIYTEMQEKYGRPPESIITPTALHKESDLFWEFWEMKMLMLSNAKPCDAHRGLVELQKKTNFLEVTQNVDGLSIQAGMPEEFVIELHGNAYQYRCNRCGVDHQLWIREGMGTQRCYRCGDPDNAPIRPKVVLFGENIKTENYKRSLLASKNADVFITIGTTLQFGYLQDFLYAATANNAYVINIDPDAQRSSYFDICLPWTASDGLKLINDCITETTTRDEFVETIRNSWS